MATPKTRKKRDTSGETILEFRRLIRQYIRECYGWPVEKEESVYGVKHPEVKGGKDPKNSALRLPKGLNSKSPV